VKDDDDEKDTDAAVDIGITGGCGRDSDENIAAGKDDG
jgi:hypothetical protein